MSDETDGLINAAAARNASLRDQQRRLRAACETMIERGNREQLVAAVQGALEIVDALTDEVTGYVGEGAALYATDEAFRRFTDEAFRP
jgi:hypothetical protein